ncbi:MAG: hypothetical protein ACFNT5_05005 [Cardiobacterium hominis]
MLGLQKLLALQLERAPALETLAKTGLVWIEAIGYERCFADEDAPRFREAFVRLAARCKSWPSPVALLEVLPDRPPLPALPEPEISPEQRAENLAFLDDLLAGIRMPGSKPREEAEQHRGRFRVVGGEA